MGRREGIAQPQVADKADFVFKVRELCWLAQGSQSVNQGWRQARTLSALMPKSGAFRPAQAPMVARLRGGIRASVAYSPHVPLTDWKRHTANCPVVMVQKRDLSGFDVYQTW